MTLFICDRCSDTTPNPADFHHVESVRRPDGRPLVAGGNKISMDLCGACVLILAGWCEEEKLAATKAVD